MNGYWHTRDGERLLIKDLATDHLMNIIRMLHKNAVRDKEGMIEALIFRAEFAQSEEEIDQIINEIERIENASWMDFVLHKEILKEGVRRGLDRGVPDPMDLLYELMGVEREPRRKLLQVQRREMVCRSGLA